ncbi:MAG: hypothetical protein RL571_3026 [Pseudomonadota bacterium]|jgi:hypothetical protein
MTKALAKLTCQSFDFITLSSMTGIIVEACLFIENEGMDVCGQ